MVRLTILTSFSKVTFHVRNDFLNEEMQSFLTAEDTIFTVGKEESKNKWHTRAVLIVQDQPLQIT